METSFRLTPELRQRLVQLAYRNPVTSSLDPFTNQLEIMERDPDKREFHRVIVGVSGLFVAVRLYLGGVGLYSSMRDYLKLLRHLMQINGTSS